MATFRGIALTIAMAHFLACWDGGRIARLPPGPTVLATGTELGVLGYGRLVSDGHHVYWSEGSILGEGSIRRVAVTGGTPEILVTGQSLPSGIDVDDTSVYWVESCCENQHVRKLSKSGGTPVDLAALPAQSVSLGLSVRAGWVYVAVSPWLAPMTGILRVATDGGAMTWVSDVVPCDRVSVNDAAIYCRSPPDPTQMLELALAGGASTADPLPNVLALAATGTRVYWTDTTGLMTASSGSLGMPTALGPIANAFEMALGREQVFVTSHDQSDQPTGSIVMFPLTGAAAPVTLAEGLQPFALAADHNSVFWVSGTTLTRLSY